MISTNNPLKELEATVLEALRRIGPASGQKLIDFLPDFLPIDVWRVCYLSNMIRIRNCARYYIRYDITRQNQLRLSPSILRDFLTFSIIYTPNQRTVGLEDSAVLANKHRLISQKKLSLARKAIMSLDTQSQNILQRDSCAFVSGDVAYFLGHNTPRIHKQSKTKINGSDVDVVFVFNNHVKSLDIKRAEEQFLEFKYVALKDPSVGEELDFIFKPITKMMEQMQYRNINEKIASKILYESLYTFGRLEIYEGLMAELEFSGAKAKIEKDFKTALYERKETYRKLLSLSGHELQLDSETESLFYFSQERLEFQ